MSTSIRMTEREQELVKNYAKIHGISVGEAFKRALFEAHFRHGERHGALFPQARVHRTGGQRLAGEGGGRGRRSAVPAQRHLRRGERSPRHAGLRAF